MVPDGDQQPKPVEHVHQLGLQIPSQTLHKTTRDLIPLYDT
jgi:hypothetical protein